MMSFPSIPGWDGIHPLMVQFAIVLLLTAPLLLLVSLFTRGAWRAWSSAALLLMVLGTLAAWIAVGSGHAAGQLVEKTPALERAITAHEALGIQTRTLFTILTLVFAALIGLPVLIKKALPVAARIGVHAVFLLAYLGAATVIANTADRGGRLVHEFGVQAMVERGAQPAAPASDAQATPPPVRAEKEEPSK